MARILGLDLGSASVKAVLLETALRGFTVKQVAEVAVPAEGELNARLASALGELLQRFPLAADTVAVALPGSSLATHPITLPFSDPKKIDATLAFEVEGQLPYDLSEAQFDYQVAQVDEKGTALNVGVVRKHELSALLEVLKASKLDPRVISHPGLVVQTLLTDLPANALPDNPADAIALVDLGHERITVAIGRPGGLVEATRTFPGGGLALSKALATEFDIGLPAAQAWKEQHGAVGSEVVGPEAERAAAAFLRALLPVLRELRPTFKAYTARSRRGIGRILLTGGTARLKGLAEQLQRDLDIPTLRYELPHPLRSVAGTAAGPQLAQAWALALRGEASGAKAPRFNLRRGEFAFRSDFDALGERLGQLAAFATLLFVLLIASGIVRNSVLQRREKQVDAELCTATQRVLGRCEKNFDVALNLLKGKESVAAGIPSRSAATLLAELTQRIPSEVPLTFDQVAIDLDRISLRCETATSKQVEDVIAMLKAAPCFKDVKEGKLEKSKDGAKVSFRLEIQVECPEDHPTPQG